MDSTQLKKSLHHIAEGVDESTSLEDIFKELSLLSDIDESERQEEAGETLHQSEVEKMAKQWLK